jgi:hypothetical protein
LAGFLIGLNVIESLRGLDLHVVKRKVYDAARSHNKLSDGMLLLARDGRVSAKVKKLLDALFLSANGEGREAKRNPRRSVAPTIEECTRDLCAVGATSGADLATGLLMTLRAGLAVHTPSHTTLGATFTGGGASWS